ncbi:female-specific protein transformer-like [Vespula maculifrons]|uniref:Female-specific protein transformer-like n=1 Tax=Vespula maculifrons TaxID=7453 RepID=A0ABD2CPH3_VESMC
MDFILRTVSIDEMKRSSSFGSNDERQKELRKDDHNNQLYSRLKIQMKQKREREHGRLRQKMISEYELNRAREKDASHSRGRLVEENNRKSRTRDRSLENVCIKNAKATNSKSPAIPEKYLMWYNISIQRSRRNSNKNIPVKGQINELQQDIINPEDVIIIRRSGT